MRHASSLILIASLLPLAAPAQELPRQPEGWTGTGELGLAMARGNSRSESLNTRLRFSREQER
jgi:Putative salt-induced outer membrane protein